MRFTRVTSWSFVLTLLSNELCFKSEKYRAAGDGERERERARSGSSSVFLSTQFSGKRATENFTVFSVIFNASTFLRCRALSRFACTFADLCVARTLSHVVCCVLKSSLCYCTKCDFRGTRLSKCSMKFNTHYFCCHFNTLRYTIGLHNLREKWKSS